MPQNNATQHNNSHDIDLMDFFPYEEAGLYQWFGRPGQGKTYLATREVLRRLKEGRVVYTNWKIEWDGYDERKSIKALLFSFFTGRELIYLKKDNWKFIDIDEHFVDTLEKLTDCEVFLDEGHVVFDSYEMAKMSIQKRKAVLHTRHFDRTIHVISQRFTAIHPTIRENVNAYYECKKVFQWGKFILFRKTELDTIGDKLDLENPVNTELVVSRKEVFNAYSSKYLRYDMESSQKPEFELYKYTRKEALLALWRAFRPPERNVVDERLDI